MLNDLIANPFQNSLNASYFVLRVILLLGIGTSLGFLIKYNFFKDITKGIKKSQAIVISLFILIPVVTLSLFNIYSYTGNKMNDHLLYNDFTIANSLMINTDKNIVKYDNKIKLSTGKVELLSLSRNTVWIKYRNHKYYLDIPTSDIEFFRNDPEEYFIKHLNSTK